MGGKVKNDMYEWMEKWNVVIWYYVVFNKIYECYCMLFWIKFMYVIGLQTKDYFYYIINEMKNGM